MAGLEWWRGKVGREELNYWPCSSMEALWVYSEWNAEALQSFLMQSNINWLTFCWMPNVRSQSGGWYIGWRAIGITQVRDDDWLDQCVNSRSGGRWVEVRGENKLHDRLEIGRVRKLSVFLASLAGRIQGCHQRRKIRLQRRSLGDGKGIWAHMRFLLDTSKIGR